MPAAPDAPAIDVRGVGKRFGPAIALSDVSFTVAPGEFVTLFGPNGAGKTTLVRIVATLARATSGSVHIQGTEVRSGHPDLRRAIGVVSHRSFLYGELTARENLEFFGRLFGLSDPGDRAVEAAGAVALERRLDDPVRSFSRGLEQRCAIARALLHEPEILLLDEPFAGLDPLASRNLEAALERAGSSGCTVLMTSHDLTRGATLATSVGILHHGRLRYWGPPTEDLEAEFIKATAGAA